MPMNPAGSTLGTGGYRNAGAGMMRRPPRNPGTASEERDPGATPGGGGGGGGDENGLLASSGNGGVSGARHAQQPRTFSDMQKAGMARPAPPAAAPPTFQSPNATGQAGAINTQLGDAVSKNLQNPNAYGSDQVAADFARLAGGIDDQYNVQNKQLEEQMARRGLDESSIHGGRLADSNVQRRTAKIDLADRLASHEADAESQARIAAINAAMGYGSQQFDQSLAGYGANRSAYESDRSAGQTQQQIDTARELGLGNLDVSKGNLALTGELGRGNLGVAQQSAATQQKAQEAEAAYQSGQISLAQRDATLRELQNTQQNELANKSLTQQGDLTHAEIDAANKRASDALGLSREQMTQDAALTREGRTFTSGESALERTSREKQAADQLAAEQAMQKTGLDATASLSAADRTSREGMQKADIDAANRRASDVLGLNRDQLAFQREDSTANRAQNQGQFDKRLSLDENNSLSSFLALLQKYGVNIAGLYNGNAGTNRNTSGDTGLPGGDGRGSGGGGPDQLNPDRTLVPSFLRYAGA